METRTVEQVESWSTRSFSDGFAGLRELSDGEFSGAVRANGAWLFMLNGRIVGVYEGSLDDFEDADGTAYAAPHPSLPLLFSMQEQGGDTRAKYYTNDTPLSEVDSTLTEGNFTGFIELSENVLSGDYYVTYYGGRSMSVAFVGASDQVVTGDEAFERAADEVGIYEVTDVDVEVTDVPEPEGSDEPDAGASGPSNAPSAGSSGAAGSGSSDEPGGTGTADGPGGRAGQGAGQPSATESAAGEPSPGASAAGEPPTGPSAAGQTGQSSAGQSTAEQAAGNRQAAGQSPSDGPSAGESSADRPPAGESGSTAGSGETGTATDAIRQPEAEDEPTDGQQRAEAGAGATAESPAAGSGSEPSIGSTAPGTTDAAETRDDASGTREGATPTRADSTPTRDDSAATRDDPAGETASAESETDSSDDETDAFAEEAEWRETTTIPSLDPDRSEGPDENTSGQGSTSSGSASAARPSTGTSSGGATASGSPSGTGTNSGGSAKRTADSGTATGGGRSQSSKSDRTGTNRQSGGGTADGSGAGATGSSGSTGTEAGGAGGSSGADDARARIKKLRSQLKQRKQQVQQLKERLSKVESERDEFERERDALRQEVERLEAKLETVSSGGSSADGRQLSRAQAFDGTNLFVRYQSKGKATLEEAAENEADPEDVNANLRLEHHTQFETDGATVDGRAFEEFLTDSFEYRFVSWLIEDLLYEIRDTGHRSNLQNLYESIPKIDRVDLHGSVSAGDEEDDTRTESFDVIARDRMGNPLLVADLNDSREPTTGDMMGALVDAATGVGQAHDELSGAFQVTESFFEPEALETADTATTGGFLSREKRESFVKLSRKRGYHLCLVESRSGGFHLNVPEL